jgi:hypothetical protein
MHLRWGNYVLAITCLGVVGCRHGESHTQPQENYAVMPANASHEFKAFFGESRGIEGSWEPSKRNIESIETHLSDVSKLTSEDGIRGAKIAEPLRYRRQYVAILSQGRRLILVNAFLMEPPPVDWREHLVSIGDGGKTEWRACFDPRTDQFSHLTTNSAG